MRPMSPLSNLSKENILSKLGICSQIHFWFQVILRYAILSLQTSQCVLENHAVFTLILKALWLGIWFRFSLWFPTWSKMSDLYLAIMRKTYLQNIWEEICIFRSKWHLLCHFSYRLWMVQMIKFFGLQQEETHKKCVCKSHWYTNT